ncbi:hypothetical protein P8935_08845 [Telmatobacter sp. DSM 110680]|uniref:Uncharacterized protein n=1 Tax=Telmatobacter sp. DSM 110680 TaxID=3036704 RepID=A0AAU7DRM7_9BACT
MNYEDQNAKLTGQAEDPERLQPELRKALDDFKLSVDAWSEAMISRPREAQALARRNWSAITKWAMGCLVFAGTVSSGVYQNHKQVEAARVEATRIAEQQRAMEAAKVANVNEEDLMADVDSDVARQVPSALEPMATMMNDDQTKGN